MNIDQVGQIQIGVEDLLGRCVAVLGLPGSGKSNTAAVLAEELLLAGVPVQIVDIAGEYYSLRERFPHVAVVGRSVSCLVDKPFGDPCLLAEKIYTKGLSAVLDVSGLVPGLRRELLAAYFGQIWDLAVVKRIPSVVFLEEAHNWIPQRGNTAVSDVFTNMATEGRKRGLSVVMVGQRSARIHKDVLTQADIYFLHRVRHFADMSVYQELIPRRRGHVKDMVGRLRTGDVLFLRGESVISCQIRQRFTRHVGYTPGLADVPASAQLSLLDFM